MEDKYCPEGREKYADFIASKKGYRSSPSGAYTWTSDPGHANTQYHYQNFQQHVRDCPFCKSEEER